MMPPPPDGVPIWVWKTAAWIVGGVFALLTTVVGWLGKRFITRRDAQIEKLEREMHGDHDEVMDKVEELEDKVDAIADKLDADT